MTYVGSPFKHDIFVSYSHGDADRDGISKLKQYSRAFENEFTEEIKTLMEFGRSFDIFRDDSLSVWCHC